jgi:hypothetical protein
VQTVDEPEGKALSRMGPPGRWTRRGEPTKRHHPIDEPGEGLAIAIIAVAGHDLPAAIR